MISSLQSPTISFARVEVRDFEMFLVGLGRLVIPAKLVVISDFTLKSLTSIVNTTAHDVVIATTCCSELFYTTLNNFIVAKAKHKMDRSPDIRFMCVFDESHDDFASKLQQFVCTYFPDKKGSKSTNEFYYGVISKTLDDI